MSFFIEKYSIFYILFLLFLFLSPLSAYAEYIESFASDIEIRTDASFTVTETIEYVFTEPRHGIFRYIPVLHPELSEHALKERIIKTDVLSARMDGAPVPFEESVNDEELYLKIGDPNTTIEGNHTYEITYTVQGGLSYPINQGVEFYYNITGNGWEVPMKSVSARLWSPESIFLQNKSCYRDIKDTSGSCSQTVEEDGSIEFRATELRPGEGMTVAQALDVRAVDRVLLERFKILWILIPFGVLIVSALSIFVYRFKTKYQTGRTIIPEYEPYPGVKPMYTGLLMDDQLDPRDITACIVYLAEQGYIKIRKIIGEKYLVVFSKNDDYEFTLTRDIGILESQFESSVLSLIFKLESVVGDKITLAQIKKDQMSILNLDDNTAKINALGRKLDNDLVASGFFENLVLKWSIIITVSLISLIGLLSGGLMALLAILFAVAFFASIIFTYSRRTRKGYEALDHLKGFKLFLEMTEKDRYAFHNAPEKSPEQFMEYLPYAIAFGVEKEWAKTFEGITIPNPGWYDGGSVGAFSAINLTSSLGGFSTAFASSSGSSASSGGGSSGGGSGGGGGGSW